MYKIVRYLFILLFTSTLLSAQSDLIISKDGDIFDDFALEMYEDSSASLSLEEVKNKKEFKSYTNKISLGYSDSAFWFKFRLKNATSKELNYLIRFSENMADELDCFIVSQSDEYISYRAGISTYIEKNNDHIKPKFKIKLNASESKTIYIRLVSKYSNFTSIEILNEEILDNKIKNYDRYYIFYFGAIFSLLLYNLVLVFYSRDIAYLYYVLYGVLFLSWQMELNAFPPFDSYSSASSYYLISGIIIPLMISFFLLYSRVILETKSLFPKVDKYLIYIINFYLFLAILSTINLNLAFVIINALATFIIPFMLFLGFKSYAKGNKIALFYIVAQSSFIFGSIFFSLMSDGYLGYNSFNRHAIVVGSLIEIIMFSLALGYRLRLSHIEKIEIISKTNMELEEKIEIRTVELKNMLDRTMEAVGIYENHICIETNNAAVEIYGYESKEQMLGKKAIYFVAPSSRKLALKYMREVYTKPYEIMALRADGSEFPALIKGSHYTIDDRVLGMVAVLDLTEIKENEKQLILAKQKAEEATQTKSNFLANMSHEIRTPMNGIIGMTKLIQKTTLEDKQKHYVEVIDSSANSLLSIINDILDFSKIEAKKLEIDKINFNLLNLISNVKNIVEFKAKEKDLSLEIIYDEEIVNLYGDSQRISQVLLNLLNNAIKFTNKGFVKLTISNRDKNFTFKVEDSGIGVSEEEQLKLFQSFMQADASTTRKYGGTGLGLSISQELVNLMGGNITLKSEKGVGSSFSFTLELPYSDVEHGSESKNISLANNSVKAIEITDFENVIKSEREEEVFYDKIDLLFADLKESASTARPQKCQVVVQKLQNYVLNQKDEALLSNTKRLLKTYKFKKLLELLEER